MNLVTDGPRGDMTGMGPGATLERAAQKTSNTLRLRRSPPKSVPGGRIKVQMSCGRKECGARAVWLD